MQLMFCNINTDLFCLAEGQNFSLALYVCVYRCCLSHHTYTHEVPKGAFNVLQNSLAYQIPPEKAKALCVCMSVCAR